MIKGCAWHDKMNQQTTTLDFWRDIWIRYYKRTISSAWKMFFARYDRDQYPLQRDYSPRIFSKVMDEDIYISATKSLPSGIYTTCEKDKRREKLNLKEDCKVLLWLNPHRCVDWRVNASMKTSSTHEEEGADIYQLLYLLQLDNVRQTIKNQYVVNIARSICTLVVISSLSCLS